jgi:hypothetical protein
MALALVPRDSQPAPAPTSTSAGPGPLVDAWWSAMSSSWQFAEQLWALYDPRRVRGWWLADLNQLTAELLRSRAFLAWMRITLK